MGRNLYKSRKVLVFQVLLKMSKLNLLIKTVLYILYAHYITQDHNKPELSFKGNHYQLCHAAILDGNSSKYTDFWPAFSSNKVFPITQKQPSCVPLSLLTLSPDL